jgi:hypothetical protein
MFPNAKVAPLLVGAWIEINTANGWINFLDKSHPFLWVRGLKQTMTMSGLEI